MMNTGDSTYKITRRDALCELASIPMIALGQKQTLHAKRYEEMLRYCTAALEACWELYRGSDPIGTQHAFDCVCTYLPMLEAIAKDSSHYRKQALDLATQYALLQTFLGWNYGRPGETVDYAQNALSLSKETGDILFQLSAYSKLSWAYVQNRNYMRAWETMQEGESILKNYQRSNSRAPLPSGIIGNFYSSYAMAQIRNGIQPDIALGIATDSEPLKGRVALVEFTETAQWLEAARICIDKGDSTQAMIWIGKRIDLETLAPRVPQSERGRIQSINIMTQSLLHSGERDMGRIIAAWTAGMKGAKALHSEEIYAKAITNFAIMQALWPSEDRIMKLLPLTAHW